MNSLNSSKMTEDELSLSDILFILARNWKLISSFVFAGLLASGIYLAITPSQYEAKASIVMARISSVLQKSAKHKNVENPIILIERLKNPSTYSPKVIAACDLIDNVQPAESLVKMLKISHLNGHVVNFSIRRNEQNVAKKCITGLYEMIRNHQQALSLPYEEELKTRLNFLERRSERLKKQLLKAGSKREFNAIYITHISEYLDSSNQIESIRREKAKQGNYSTKLLSPIYVSPKPVFPKRIVTLIIGTVSGFIFGLSFVFGRIFINNNLVRSSNYSDNNDAN